MAGAIAHELNKPLTALTNSVNAARRPKGAHNRLDTACTVLSGAAEHALRAGEPFGGCANSSRAVRL
jgi:C4-dicarboxylate-specific signal transduction histidine kinase